MSQDARPRVLRNDPDGFRDLSGIRSRLVFPWPDGPTAPFTSAWGLIEPGRAFDVHHHHEVEAFYIVKGHGVARVADRETEVTAGDVLLVTPLCEHTICNTDGEHDLVFVTVFWSETAALVEAFDDRAQGRDDADHRPAIAIGSPPTPNGDLHLGHLAGPYLGADAWARYLRLRGRPVHQLFGVDEHQSYVGFAARQQGLEPEQLADHYVEEIRATLAAIRIEPDVFSRPTRWPATATWTDDLIERLTASDDLYVAALPTLFCVVCDDYRFEAGASGLCPRCSAPAPAGNCEACGRLFPGGELVDPICKVCGGSPEARPLPRLYFALSRHQERVAEHVRTTLLSPRVRGLCLTLLERGLEDVPVSSPDDWGVPVPFPELVGQRLLSFFTCGLSWWLGATNQLTAELGEETDEVAAWSGQGSPVIFTGFDTAIYYAMIYPAMCFAYGRIAPPVGVVVNELYRLDGEKFSTSRRHAVWGRELVERGGADAARFYLAWDRPELEETNFTLSGFDQVAEEVLGQEWEPWAAALAQRLRLYADGIVAEAGPWRPVHEGFFRELQEYDRRLRACYELETFSLQQAARALRDLVRAAGRFALATDPLTATPGGGDELRTAIALEVLAAKVLAVAASPLMPDTADHLWRALGLGDGVPAGAWNHLLDWVPAGNLVDGLDRLHLRPLAVGSARLGTAVSAVER